ncbi:MAG: class II aldolase/adducin family protein [Anaerolineae bacterium]|nr:class II aldolase/adducin family protein [Anaerolineae bacterium]
MTTESNPLPTLLKLTHELGNPANDYSILAEGNTSTRIDKDTFWVKASGYFMRDLDEAGFVAMRFKPVLDLLDGPALSDADLKVALNAAKVDPSIKTRPSVEVVLHAILLSLGGASWVGHTHPAAWNSILCSRCADDVVKGRMFPDQIVVCGPAPLYIKYTDPGIPLAREVKEKLLKYIDAYGMGPKEILMQNHGLIALGDSAAEVERVTAMSVKSARIMLHTYALGGPNFLSEKDVSHLWTRPDEIERRQKLV